MSPCNKTFDLKINLGHSDLYVMVQWFLLCYFFALKNILVLLAKPDSGELRCPATALIWQATTVNLIFCFYWFSRFSDEITALFVLCKFILQTRQKSVSKKHMIQEVLNILKNST